MPPVCLDAFVKRFLPRGGGDIDPIDNAQPRARKPCQAITNLFARCIRRQRHEAGIRVKGGVLEERRCLAPAVRGTENTDRSNVRSRELIEYSPTHDFGREVAPLWRRTAVTDSLLSQRETRLRHLRLETATHPSSPITQVRPITLARFSWSYLPGSTQNFPIERITISQE